MKSCFIGMTFHFVFVFFLAPDENPTDVQGFGTEHNNLVISWKVISCIRLFVLILKHLLLSREYYKPRSFFSPHLSHIHHDVHSVLV